MDAITRKMTVLNNMTSNPEQRKLFSQWELDFIKGINDRGAYTERQQARVHKIYHDRYIMGKKAA